MGDNKPKTRMRYCELSCTTKGAKEGTNYPKIEGGKKHLQASFKINTWAGSLATSLWLYWGQNEGFLIKGYPPTIQNERVIGKKLCVVECGVESTKEKLL